MNKKTQKSSATDSEKFVNAIAADDNVEADKYLEKLVQSKCEDHFKKTLTKIRRNKTSK